MIYLAQMYVAVGDKAMWAFDPTGPIALVTSAYGTDLILRIDNNDGRTDPLGTVWKIGNRMAADVDGRTWPSDVRSMCVGDIVKLTTDEERSRPKFWYVTDIGFGELPELANTVVPLIDNHHTSRTSAAS